MSIGEPYQKCLSPQEQKAVAAACTLLIDAFFDEWNAQNWQEGIHLTTRLGKHLPRRYASQYTPFVLKQFGICVVTVVWKLAQCQRVRLASLGEELAAWAIVEEAREILQQESKEAPALQTFVSEYFQDTRFLALFDEMSPDAERDSCENWFQPKAGGQAYIPHPYACSGKTRTNVGRAYKEWLPSSKQKALAAGIELLIDQLFDDFAYSERDNLSFVADTTLAWHLPEHYLPKYSHQFLKQFSVCILIVAWKLAQPKAGVLSSIAEELAAWAILTSAQVHIELMQEVNHAQTVENLFGGIVSLLFEDTDFLFLFSPEHDGIETTMVGQMMHMTSLAFADWFRPFGDDSSYRAHPYVWKEDYAE